MAIRRGRFLRPCAGIRCRSSSNSNSSSFEHPLAKLLPAGHRQVVAGSRYRNCQLPITCNSWPASVSGRSPSSSAIVLIRRPLQPNRVIAREATVEIGRRIFSREKRLPESESSVNANAFPQLFDIRSFYFWPGFLSSRNLSPPDAVKTRSGFDFCAATKRIHHSPVHV